MQKSLGLAKSLLSDLRDAVTEIRESAFLDFSQAVRSIIANVSELDVERFVEEGLVIGNAETVETGIERSADLRRNM